jgi:hypothetical protein
LHLVFQLWATSQQDLFRATLSSLDPIMAQVLVLLASPQQAQVAAPPVRQ